MTTVARAVAPEQGNRAARPLHPLAPVLRGRPLQPCRPVPVCGDDVWDLSAAVSHIHVRHSQSRIDFTLIDDPERRACAKQLVHALLNEHPHRGAKRKSVSTACRMEDHLEALFAYLKNERGDLPLPKVTQDHLDQWLVHLRSVNPGIRPKSLSAYVRAAKALWTYRRFIAADNLVFEPWKGIAATAVTGAVADTTGNATPALPDRIMHPLLRASLFYVEHASADILAARSEADRLLAHKHRMFNGGTLANLRAWIDARAAAGRGIPTPHGGGRTGRHTPGQPNMSLVKMMSTGPEQPVADRLIREAADRLGLEPGGMDIDISDNPLTGKPWRPRFGLQEVAAESRCLVAACYVVIAYLSGMRVSEVASLRRDCYTSERTADGVLVRHKLKGTTVKGKTAPTPATWVTVEPVKKAVDVLLAVHQDDVLFTRSIVQGGAPAGTALTDDTIIRWIDQPARHAGTLCDDWHVPLAAPADEPAPTPDAPGPDATQLDRTTEPAPAPADGDSDDLGDDLDDDPDGEPETAIARVLPKHFRQTLARHLARQPFGVVAGMLQYQQVGVAIFEGYAGTAESGFLAEMAEEEALARLDDMLERYDEHKAGRARAGGAADRVGHELDRIRTELGDFPGRTVDGARLRTMLGHLARTLHPGALNDCFYDPGNNPLCHAAARGARRDTPVMPFCQPAKCANSCITQRHVPAWERIIADGDSLLAHRGLGTQQRAAVQDSVTEWKAAIAPLAAPAAEEQE